MITTNNINYIKENVKKFADQPKIIVDCTAGNGNDLFFLAETFNDTKIYAFDVQKEAIENSKKRCREFNNIIYVQDSHSNIDNYIRAEIDIMIFNLGYLPNSQKNIVTKFDTTIEAIEKGLKLLKVNGCIIVTMYKGKENIEETNRLKEYFKTLDKEKIIVSRYQLYNLKNAPENIIIERKV